MGKSKPYFVRNLDCGDFVVVLIQKKLKLQEIKKSKKLIIGIVVIQEDLKQETLSDLRKRKPNDIIIHAVKGMLPQNRLRDKMLARLKVFEGEENTYTDKFIKKG